MKKNRIAKNLIAKALDQYIKERYITKTQEGKINKNVANLEIGYEIYKARKQRKLTQFELARRVSTTQSVIARIETGEQNLTTATLNQIAKALGKELRVALV